jgi:hypothetical protein
MMPAFLCRMLIFPCRPEDRARKSRLDIADRSSQFLPMKSLACAAAALLSLAFSHAALAAPEPLSDGKTFAGWDGETNSIWHVRDGAFVGGKPPAKVPQNEFLATARSYTNFVLRLEFKLTGTEGFVNGGVQFRSQRRKGDSEMIGYQADIGEGWFGSLYDESRRNKLMAKADEAAVKRAVKAGEWNRYEIRCEGRRIVLKINGVQTVDYTEADATIPQWGRIGLQVHGGGVTEASYRAITIEELP